MTQSDNFDALMPGAVVHDEMRLADYQFTYARENALTSQLWKIGKLRNLRIESLPLLDGCGDTVQCDPVELIAPL